MMVYMNPTHQAGRFGVSHMHTDQKLKYLIIAARARVVVLKNVFPEKCLMMPAWHYMEY